MTNANRARIALLSLALASCGGNNNAGTSSASSTPIASGNEQRRVAVTAQDDVSEVAAPNELVALIRATSVRAVASRIARFGFVSEQQATGMADEMLQQAIGHEALARVVQTDRPMDGAVVFAGGRPTFVVSLAVPAPAETARRLASAYRTRPLGNGVLELTPVAAARTQEPESNNPEEAEAEQDDRWTCFVSPTPRATEGRLTCTNGARAGLEIATPFLARTLTRREPRQEAIVATVFPNAVRAMVGQDATRTLDEMERDIDRDLANSNEPPFNHPEVRQPVVRFLREFAANLRTLWTETSGLNQTIAFDDNGVRSSSSFDLTNPTGSYARGWIDATRSAPPLPEQHLQRIPSDVGVVMGGSIGHQAWGPQARPLTEIAVALGRSEARLPAAQLTQLQEILTNNLALDLSGVIGVGADAQGRPSTVSVLRFADAARATAAVTDTRRLLAIVRAPAFGRAIDTLLRRADAPRVMQWNLIRELPTRGLPAGAFAFQLPDFSKIARDLRQGSTAPSPRGRRPPPTPVLQYILVPDGAYVTMVSGADARALWTAAAARTGAPLDLAAHGIRAGALSMSIIPAGLPNLLVATDPSGATNMRTRIARMPDQGATPAILRMSNAEVDGSQRFSFDIEVQAATLRGIAAAMR